MHTEERLRPFVHEATAAATPTSGSVRITEAAFVNLVEELR